MMDRGGRVMESWDRDDYMLAAYLTSLCLLFGAGAGAGIVIAHKLLTCG